MKRLLFITVFLLLKGTFIFACCAEKNYRLFPLGELDENILFMEFDLNRNCRYKPDIGKKHEFWTKGIVRLVQYDGDSLVLIQAIDTIDIIECICDYQDFYEKTEYETEIAKNYAKGLKIARQINGFRIANPTEIVFNDTLNTQIIEDYTDTSYSQILIYKDTVVIDFGLEEIISSYPDKVAEVRRYETENYEITILRLRCSLLEKQAIKYNTPRFDNVETAFWKEQAQWHGIAKDYLVVKSKN